MPNQTELELQFKQAVEAFYEVPSNHMAAFMDVTEREGEQAAMAMLLPLIKAAEKRVSDVRSLLTEWFPDHPVCGVIDLDLYYLNRNHPMIWEVLREEQESELREELETDEAYNEALAEIEGESSR